MQAKSADSSATTKTRVQRLTVDDEQAGQRIDNYLMRILPGVPRGRVYRILRRGEVRVNGGRVRAEYKLRSGDEVRVPPASVKAEGASPPAHRARQIEDWIVFEDKTLIVINKPGGLAVHGGSGISFGVIELLRAARPDLRDLSLAHRIDRETSGCLVIARKRSVLRRLHAMFREGRVEKNYLALVHGDWQYGDIVIDQPLLVTNRKGGERHVIVSPRGKPAQTRVRLSRRFGEFSLVQCQPATGRTHQIRVHLAQMGHPIAGDSRYGDETLNRRASALGLPRLFLHAQSIAFVDENGNEQHFTAPLSPDLERFVNEVLQ